MLDEGAMLTFIAALFAIMNPVGNVAVFASLTEGESKDDIRSSAWTCAIACAVTLLVVTWIGDYVLKFFGISVDALRAAGGIILLLIGLSMLANNNQHRHTDAETEDARTRPEIGVVPMAIPIVAGPGTIATVLIMSQDQTWVGRAEISGIIVLMSLAVGWFFSMSKLVSDRLGVAGMAVVTRLMGMILATIAITMLAVGFKGLWPGLS